MLREKLRGLLTDLAKTSKWRIRLGRFRQHDFIQDFNLSTLEDEQLSQESEEALLRGYGENVGVVP